MLLTDTKIKNLKPSSKAIRLKDGGGLFLVIRPNGNKFWQIRYCFLEKEKTLSLGRYPMVSLAAARERRMEVQCILENGKDPSVVQRQEKQDALTKNRNTFGIVAKEWFESYQEGLDRKHAQKTWGRLENHILPNLGRRPITEIKPLELLDIIRKVERKGATDMSRRLLQLCRRILNYGIVTGRLENNIAIGLGEALRRHKTLHQPTLSDDEISDFLNALNQLDSTAQNKIAFKLLLLTALRTGELRQSKWEDIDLESREWRVRAEIMKMRRPHLVPLSKQSLELLYHLKEITGSSEWLFPSQQKQVHPIMSENTINSMIKRMGYKGRIVGHGFRSMFSTIANENGFNRDAIERQLAHVEGNAVRAAYNRAEYMDERAKLMQWWADFIDSKMLKSESINSGASSVNRYSAVHFEGQDVPSYSVFPNLRMSIH